MPIIKNTSVDIVGDKVRVSVPFSKIDTEKRMVHGFATLDNLDSQDDIVLYEASVKAFEAFRGNIREMHDLKAVGKMVSFRPENLYDANSGQLYKGIFVSTYVSKGAQDTWEKVIDGTLTGFSIGGNILKASNRFDEIKDKLIRIVEDYEMSELSLVDNPANTLANVVSFEKGMETGYISKTKSENVFYCKVHNVVQFSSDGDAECYQCGKPMSNIGFVESDDVDKISVVKSMLAHVKNLPEVGDMVDFDEGFGKVESIHSHGEILLPGIEKVYAASETNPIAIITICEENDDTMNKTNHRIIKNLSSITKMKEVEKVDNEVIETAEVVEETVEISKAVEVIAVESATEAPAPEIIEKSEFAEIKEMLESITKALSAIPATLEAVAKRADAAVEAVDAVNEVAKAATADLEKAKSENQELGKRLEAVEGSTAFRKSADVGEIVQTPPKVESVWGGRFLDSTTKSL